MNIYASQVLWRHKACLLLCLQPLSVKISEKLLYYLLLLHMGFEVLIDTVMELDLVISYGNRLCLLL